MGKKNKKPKKDFIVVSEYALMTANGAWRAIGEGAAPPIHIIAEAVQMGILAGVQDTQLRMRTPPVPPPGVAGLMSRKNKKEKKS
jgi:hypothetical protein